MEMRMEIDEADDLLDDDGVAMFLKHKLGSAKAMKQHLSETLAEVQANIAQIQVASDTIPNAPWSARTSWQRFHNGKWCFIVQLDPNSSADMPPLQHFEVVLQWSPVISPQYAVTLYSNRQFRKEVAANETLYVLIVIDGIMFTSYKQFSAAGILYCRNKDTGGQMRLCLPPLTLDAEELSSGTLNIKLLNLMNNIQEDILAALACSTEIKLYISVPPRSVTQLKDYLVIDCLCRELSLSGIAYYLFSANADHLNGCILQPSVSETSEKSHLTSFFVRNSEHLYNVLHYLKANVPGLQITPQPVKPSASATYSNEVLASQEQPEQVDGDCKEFAKCLLRQIDCVIDFQRNVATNAALDSESEVTDEYLEMRAKLTDTECASDALHAKFA